MTMNNVAQVKMQAVESSPGFYRSLTLGAVLGPVLFTIAWIVLGVLEPTVQTQYGLIGGVSGAITNPISALGVGPNARVFNVAFVACGLLTALGVLGVQRSVSARNRKATGRSFGLLLALSPLGLALAGVFTLASSLAMHNVAAIFVFVAPVIVFPLAAAQLRCFRDWRGIGITLFIAGPLTLILLVVFLLTFRLPAIVAGTGIAGLTERLLLAEIHVWYIAIGWHSFRS